ncbi:Sfh1 protein [Starmerella bacillaris]|uniref:Sfh1 protein n=1 Tax=Starmerella bacillaris TaxID=1247836 RepID=A0AAV5RL44_STABA|nr:Sfh1 protein [Starmerella bacillaris]
MIIPNPAAVPQALQTGYSSRLRLGKTSLMVTSIPAPRKRGISYVELEDEFDDDEEDPSFSTQEEENKAFNRYERGNLTNKLEIKRPAVPSRHVQYTEEQLKELGNEDQQLVPIRLSFDVEHYKVVDFFLWDVKDPSLTPEQFAIMTCQELELPVGYTSNIVNAIKSQLHDYAELASIKIPEDAGLHVIMNLSINLDKELLEDKFEWDLSSNCLIPSAFAKIVVADLGLSREFVPAITHALYEQILGMKRAIFVDGTLIDVDNEVAPYAKNRDAGIRQINGDSTEFWTPSTEIMTQSEMEKREMERERIIRRMKRDASRTMSEIDLGSMLSRKRRRPEF